MLAFGSPFGLENSVSMGVVSSVARQLRQEAPMVYIQTDATINPGNSGGPLVNVEGKVVGINTMIFSQSGGSEGIGFAAPSNIVRNVFYQLRTYGGFLPGDVIYSINNKPVINLSSLRTIIDKFGLGDAVVVQVERRGELRYITFEMD